MFDGGVPEELRRYIVSPPPPPPPPPPARALPFPLSYEGTNHHFLNSVLDNNSNHKITTQHNHHHDDIKDGWMRPTDHDDDDDDSNGGHHHHHHPWSSDEVLALLRLRSSTLMENWFPGFTWEHISRKLTEVGFKRNPRECREKFEEEERRYFDNNNGGDDHINDYNSKGNFRMFSELQEFCHHGHDNHDEHVSSEVGHGHGHDNRQKSLAEPISQEKDKKKRKREGFEMLRGFCEDLVRNMIARQEEMHRKILEDMAKRDDEKVAREEAWKKQETERIDKEIEVRAHERALASDRNSTIIKFINKFTYLSEHHHDHHHQQQQHGNKVQSPSTSQSSSSLVLPQTPNANIPTFSSSQTLPSSLHHTNEKSLEPISGKTLKTKTHNPKPLRIEENCGLGKRWPRDEVLALVNIRCSISAKINGDHHHHHKDGSPSTSKSPPLWERISKKMLELGYKRSAKRCKEKWENINKYFRKTKDVNKKRPLDSRTCPYFHQLSALYSQGSLSAAAGVAKLDSGHQDPRARPEEIRVGSSSDHGAGVDSSMHVAADGDENEKNTVQASGFDFEF